MNGIAMWLSGLAMGIAIGRCVQIPLKFVQDKAAARNTEIRRLRDLSGRVEEADYGMVAGNPAHDAIPWSCADRWFYYIRTGKTR